MESPYRRRAGPRSAPRTLSFHHARLLLLSVIAGVAVAAIPALVTTPRDVTLECRPDDEPGLRCTSGARSIWGQSEPKRSRVVAPLHRYDRLPAFMMAPPLPPRLDVEIAYRRSRGESWSRITARYDYRAPVDLTESYPTRFGSGIIRDLSTFRSTLSDGKPATLRYRSGWGGQVYAVLLPIFVLGLLFPASGRTRVVVDPDEESLTIETRNFWLMGTTRRQLPLHEVVAAGVVAAPASQGKVYLPALHLRGGEVVTLGKTGLAVPTRAEFWAGKLAEMLSVPRAELVQKTVGGS